MSDTKWTVIDLFSGAGGFSTGFLMTEGFQILAGVDNTGFLEKSFVENHPGAKFIQYDIRNEVPEEILDLNPDIVIGSPPCQGFSDARGVRYRLDRKNDLVFKYYDWIDQIRPKIAIMENVKGMSTIGKAWRSLEHPEQEEDIDFMELLKNTANDIGYTFKYEILNSKEYSVPQDRQRVFCIMTEKNFKDNISFPPRTHSDGNNKDNQVPLDYFWKNGNQKELLEPITIKEALEGLPQPFEYINNIDPISPIPFNIKINGLTSFQKQIFDSDYLTNHIARFPKDNDEIEIIKRIPEGQTYRSDRLGDKHIGVWDVFKDQLNSEQQELLRKLARLRTQNHVKTKKGKHSEGYVPLEFLINEGFSQDIIENLVVQRFLKKPKACKLTEKAKIELEKSEIEFQKVTNEEGMTKSDNQILSKLKRLQDEYSEEIREYQIGIQNNTLTKLMRYGWIEIGEIEGEYDLTSKAGHRGKYSRLATNEQSRTLMTGFANLSEILHPTKNRGLSLREGARLMSFPDSFTFYGTFMQISLQIGNAVAPLISRAIASEILRI